MKCSLSLVDDNDRPGEKKMAQSTPVSPIYYIGQMQLKKTQFE